jgi:hypothetical protein
LASSPTINGSLTLATLPLVMMITLKIPSYLTGLCSADMNGLGAFILLRCVESWLDNGLDGPATALRVSHPLPSAVDLS